VGPPQRYRSLDAWRGIAALSVLIFHCGNTVVEPDSLAGRLLLSGWLGVFIFFPISGYCIFAALNSPHNRTIGAFLTRRWRRIVPPYWASVAFALAIAVAALPLNRGSLNDLVLAPVEWVSVATLTQVFTAARDRINPVYWSLCYEEQFYLVMATLLALPKARRPPAIALLAGAAAIYASPVWHWRLEGLFLQYWLCFAAGCAAYLWVHETASRQWAVVIATLVMWTALARLDVPLLWSAGTALALTVLARHDDALAQMRGVTPLMWVGTFSFSLYLTHVPIGGRMANLLHRFNLPVEIIVAISSLVSLAAAWLFFIAIEKRTLSRAGAAPMAGQQPTRAAA
jgi:peptidoglycan/LPS O-acetylase OafA/YrhL